MRGGGSPGVGDLSHSNQGVGSRGRGGGVNGMDDCHIKREQCNEGVGGGVASISKGWGAGNGFPTFSAILHPLALFTSRSAGVSVRECVLFYMHLLNLAKSLCQKSKS